MITDIMTIDEKVNLLKMSDDECKVIKKWSFTCDICNKIKNKVVAWYVPDADEAITQICLDCLRGIYKMYGKEAK